MNIFITGGTGFVGKALIRRLMSDGHNVTILTRRVKNEYRSFQGVSFLEGDPTQKGDWMRKLSDHDIVVNLAGDSIFKRWSRRNKSSIRNSRILTTKNIVEALSDQKKNETLFISASAVGFYGFHGDEELTEKDPSGTDFLAILSREWEETANEAIHHGVRVAICRLGIVLGKEEGALPMMIPLYKYWLGSPLGSGNQWFSWIHIQDLVNIFVFLMNNKDIKGPFNCTAPYPVTNREMTRALGEALNKTVFMPSIPGFIIRLIMGEFGNTLLKGQKVLPNKLLESGFVFQFPNIQIALKNILYSSVKGG
jgi:uncharacterized protein (TIGR01777 family)